MLLTKNKINDIWHAGFCKETVEHARTTHEHESHKRIEFLKKHIQTCHDCRNANLLKEIEKCVAEAIGPHAVVVFNAGADIAIFDEFKDALQSVLMAFARKGLVDATLFTWMAQKALRRSLDYFDQKHRGMK